MPLDRQNTDQIRAARRQREGGYLLLAILLMMAMMIIVATYYTAPRVVQQIKRDREEEMIHRGTEYARAIKKFYKKNNRYPATLDDLDKGQIRFLRKRYKDPLTKDGKWKLLNYGDIATMLNTAAPGTPAAALGQGGTLTPGGALIGGVPSPASGNLGSSLQQLQQQIQQQQQAQQPGSNLGLSTNTGQGFGSQSNPGSNYGFSGGTDQGSSGSDQSSSNPGSSFGNTTGSGFGSSQPGASNQPFGQNTTGNQQFGGGAIVGVASLSKEKTIRIYNKKKTYDEWVFIYNPMMDVANVLLRGPYQPTTIGGGQIGTPASQLGQQPNGQQGGLGQQSPFGQQPGSLGQQPGGFGQQPNMPQQYQPPQSIQPGNNYPPEQNQQQ